MVRAGVSAGVSAGVGVAASVGVPEPIARRACAAGEERAEVLVDLATEDDWADAEPSCGGMGDDRRFSEEDGWVRGREAEEEEEEEEGSEEAEPPKPLDGMREKEEEEKAEEDDERAEP